MKHSKIEFAFLLFLHSDYNLDCMPPHGYIHVLSLTENITEFEKAVHRQKISGNIDTPEGGFDAMLQAAVCEVRSFISFCSDTKFPKNLRFFFPLWCNESKHNIEEYILLTLTCHQCYSFWYVLTEGLNWERE